jgi:hypothetical protein
MNGLLCKAMFDMGRISHELRATAHICAQDNHPWEADFVDAYRQLDAVVGKLCDARSDGDEELAMRELHELAEQLTGLGFDGLADVYEALAMTPSAN